MSRIIEVNTAEGTTGTVLVTAVHYESGYTRYYVNRLDRIPDRVTRFIRSAAYAVRLSGLNDNTVVYTGGESND